MFKHLTATQALKLVSRPLLLSLYFLLLWPAGAPVHAQGVPATIVGYGATGYKYKIVPYGGDAGFQQRGYNESGFSIGDAGFGAPSGPCAFNNPGAARTDWPANTDILLRKEFNLPPGAANLTVSVIVDNDVQVYINGEEISGGFRMTAGCPDREVFSFVAPDQILTAGPNLLAVRGRDRGDLSYLDVQVTANLPQAIEVAFDINPRTCPNTLNVKAKGVLPTAILGSRDFDVSKVDPGSLRLEGVSPLRTGNADVATHYAPVAKSLQATDCSTGGPDGFLDLTVTFDNQAVAAALGAVADGQVRVLKLTGILKAEFGGAPIVGKDVVVITSKN